MFWGLIMEPQKRYTQKVEKAFHISMAALDVSTSSEEPSQVMCGFEGRNYLICTLRKPDVLQVPLDLNFTVGSELSFAANGKCHVHLTGYLIDDFPELPEDEEVEEEEEVEQKVKQKRRKRNNKEGVENGPPVKKPKAVNSQKEDEDEDEEGDEDDADSDNSLDVGALLGKTLEDDDDDDSFVEEEEDQNSEEEAIAEESDDELEEEEEADSDEGEQEVSSLSEEDSEQENHSSPQKKSKVNGISNKKQKLKQEMSSPKEKVTKAKRDKTPKDSKSPMEIKPGKTPEKSAQSSPQKKHLQGGVLVEDIKEGQGPAAKSGKFITVYYEGRLKQNNKVFDSTNKGNGFSFRLGAGEVIKGWDIGVAGMKVGGKRRIVCPPGMGYGAKGSPPAIPANSTLVFDVELRKIR